MAQHRHDFGPSASMAVPDEQGERRLFIYAARCECGAVEVATMRRTLATLEAPEVEAEREAV